MKLLVLQHEKCEPLGIFEELLKNRRVEYKYCRLYEDEAPANLNKYNSLILLGGPMNVYQEKEYPFLRDDDRLTKEALKKKKPVLGICLGAQLMAKALGASVYKAQEKEIGWYKLRLTKEGKKDRIFRGFEKEFMVFQWHGDTFDIPEGAVHLASSDVVPNQAFRFNNSYALQFHLEVTAEMIRDWLKEYDEEIKSLRGKIDQEKILSDTDKQVKNLNELAARFIDGFI